jgi:propanol-preferring alcohol dehydrogenase
MQAVRYTGVGQLDMDDVPMPAVRSGQVLLRVRAAGICQTDIHLRSSPQVTLPLGLVMGHEICGTVERVAPDVTSVGVGDTVVVYPIWSCGGCRQCLAGRQNACRRTPDRMTPPPVPGVSVDGGLAEYVVAPATALVPAEGLDHAFAATLGDAGLVPYHCIVDGADPLGPGSSAAVIGLGGLGQFAVAILRAVTRATVVGVDVRESALEASARHLDLGVLAGDPRVAQQILAVTGSHGADLVLDFVGSTETLALAVRLVAPYGRIRVPGQGGGHIEISTDRATSSLPRGATISRPYSGRRSDLEQLVALATTGAIDTDVTRYSFADYTQAFDDLEAGRVVGRAVIVMD